MYNVIYGSEIQPSTGPDPVNQYFRCRLQAARIRCFRQCNGISSASHFI